MASRNIRPEILTIVLVGGLACGDNPHSGRGGADDHGIGIGGTQTDGPRDEGDGMSGPKLDVEGVDTEGVGGDCPGGAGGLPSDEYEFSIIWIANSPEGTVSKIDTVTATELARYRTGPDEHPDLSPSRTTVNLLGDVAVANRSGSVIKIAANEERCVDANGNGVIETSKGPDDVLAWGEDECVLWSHETGFVPDPSIANNRGGPRGTAWDAAETACAPKPDVWIGFRKQPHEDVSIVRKLDGQTGLTLGEAEISHEGGSYNHGLTYGGAVDGDGAYWGLGRGQPMALVRVDPETYGSQIWTSNEIDDSGYGIAIDAAGNPWIGGWDNHVIYFDRATETFVDKGLSDGNGRLRGLAIDQNGFAWLARSHDDCALVQYDTVADTLVDGNIVLPGCNTPVGISIDADGMVWVVDRGASHAYKVDPTDYSTQIVEGLVNPYTYSDMTGAGLGLVANPPAG
jgi:hypothetical protein